MNEKMKKICEDFDFGLRREVFSKGEIYKRRRRKLNLVLVN